MPDFERAIDVLSACGRSACTSRSTTSAPATPALTHLKRLHVDVLKIDRSFVGRHRPAERDAAIVPLAGRPARRLGQRVVAEGVDKQRGLRRC